MKTLFSLAAGLFVGWSLSLAFVISVAIAVVAIFTGQLGIFLIAALIFIISYLLEWILNNAKWEPSKRLISFLERRFPAALDRMPARRNKEFIDRSVRSMNKPDDKSSA